MQKISDYLAKILEIPRDEIKLCKDLCVKKEVPKGEVLLRAGEICTSTFFVEEGLLRMYSLDENGRSHIIQFAPENWMISDRTSQFFNQESKYFIDAIEPTKLVVLRKNFITILASKNQRTGEKNEELLHKHIRNLQDRVNSLMAESAEQRYLKFMKTYPDIMRRVPQWMVASYLGIMPESLSRVRKELAKKKFQIE